MEVRAIAKNIRISPRKVRLIVDAIRNRDIADALIVLEATYKQAAKPVIKVLNSAIANAVNNAKIDRANLVIASIQVSQGQALKRFKPSTRGRVHPYKKRGSTVTVVLKEVVSAKPVVKEEKSEVKALPEKSEKGGKK